MDRDDFDRIIGEAGRATRRDELLATGVASSTLHALLRRERWQRPHRGIYVPPHVGIDDRLAAKAAVQSFGGDGAWLARGTVLWLRGLLAEAPADVQVVIHDRRQPARREGVDIMRSRTLRSDEKTTCDGLPCTTLARALRDCCATGWTVAQLLPLSLQAVQERKLRIDDLREQRRRMGRGCRGTKKVDQLIAELELDGSDSILERAGRNGLVVVRRPPDPRPFPWRAPDGVVDHFDIAFPAEWVCIFCDSRRWHGQGRAFSSDRRMWNSVAGLWRPFWLDAATVRDGMEAFAAAVDEALAAADLTREPAKREPCRCSHCLARTV